MTDKSDKWSATKRRNFKRFWNDEMGRESMKILEDLRQQKLAEALTLTDNEQIVATIHKAAGIDEAIQYIVSIYA